MHLSSPCAVCDNVYGVVYIQNDFQSEKDLFHLLRRWRRPKPNERENKHSPSQTMYTQVKCIKPQANTRPVPAFVNNNKQLKKAYKKWQSIHQIDAAEQTIWTTPEIGNIHAILFTCFSPISLRMWFFFSSHCSSHVSREASVLFLVVSFSFLFSSMIFFCCCCLEFLFFTVSLHFESKESSIQTCADLIRHSSYSKCSNCWWVLTFCFSRTTIAPVVLRGGGGSQFCCCLFCFYSNESLRFKRVTCI